MPFPANGNDLLLGRGSLMLDRLNDSNASTGFRFVGNVEAFTRSMEDDTIVFRSSTQKARPILKEVTRERTIEYLATLNEYEFNNMALHWMGDLVTVAHAADTGVVASFLAVKQGRYYDLGRRSVSSVVVQDDGGTPVTFDVTDDYTVDAARGLVYIVPGGAITDDTNLDITFNAAAGSTKKIRGGTRTVIEAKLHFESDNASGPNYRLRAHKVSITPEGEMGFITDEFGNYQLRMKVLDDSTNNPAEPLDVLEQFTAS